MLICRIIAMLSLLTLYFSAARHIKTIWRLPEPAVFALLVLCFLSWAELINDAGHVTGPAVALAADAAAMALTVWLVVTRLERWRRLVQDKTYTTALTVRDIVLNDPEILEVAAHRRCPGSIVFPVAAAPVVFGKYRIPCHGWAIAVGVTEDQARMFAGYRLFRRPALSGRRALPGPPELLTAPNRRFRWHEITEVERDWDAGLRKLRQHT